MPVTFEYGSYASGINAAALPLQNIRPDELPLMVNATVRNGFAETRPPWECQNLSFFDAQEDQLTFEQGKYQGSGQFLSAGGPLAVFVVDGKVFAYNPVTGYIQNYALDSGVAPFSKLSHHAWVQQRSQYVIVQDGQSPPFRSNGATSEQTLTVRNPFTGVLEPSVPTGTVMVDGWHRLFVADPSRSRVYASDHDMDPNSTPISFTEGTDYYLGARYFEVPPALGRIMGMSFPPYQDTSTGIGPLMVFCEKGVQAFNVAIPRTQWTTQDITQTILPSVGASSFYAYSDKGADLVFRDHEGRIRTIRNAQQFQATGANFTNDFAVWNLYKNEDASLRNFSHAVTFDRRTLILTHPQRSFLADKRYSVVHRSIAVMENDHLSDKQDVWSFWTGLNICGLVTVPVGGEDVLLAFCRDPDGVNRLYKLMKEGFYDVVPSGPKRIQMTVSTPSHDFQSSMQSKKHLGTAMSFSNLRGEVKVCGRWQPDNLPPQPWFQHYELHPNCLQFSQDPCGVMQMASGVQSRLILPAVPTSPVFRSASMTFDIYGPACLEHLRIAAEVQPDPEVTNVTCTPVLQQPGQVACAVDPLCYDAFTATSATNPTVPSCPR